MFCPYCGKEKPNTEATDEHVIPKALGGGLIPKNPFLLREVCKRCNSASGRWIDGPFIRSWFTQKQRAENAMHYFDINSNAVIPLTYMGFLKEELLTEKVCDVWLGPTGDTIYHFHAPYPKIKGASGTIGRPLYLRSEEVDPGFVFLFIRATNPAWYKPIVSSVVNFFEESTLYFGNGSSNTGNIFASIPPELTALHNQLRAMAGHQHTCKLTVAEDFGDRFLAKLALGLGALFLDPKFLESYDARRLRDFMWAKDPDRRADIQVNHLPFFSGNLEQVKECLGWSSGHVTLFLPIDKQLLLVPVLYGELLAQIVISSEPTLWEGKIDEEGSVYVIAPGLQKYIGPVSLPQYIATKTNSIESSNELTELFERVNSLGPLPPYDLPLPSN